MKDKSRDINRNEDIVKCLCEEVRKTVGFSLQTPKDFARLSEELFCRMHETISSSTLMRLWGYIDSKVQPSRYTLNFLARYIGFRDWDDFCSADKKSRQSGLVLYRHLNVAEELRLIQRLRLRWLPDRICDVRYLGNMQFVVENSVNTALKGGTTFLCMLIIEGEPLYLDDVKQHDIPGSAYICGKLNGITFELI